jgi:hypothetical protein
MTSGDDQTSTVLQKKSSKRPINKNKISRGGDKERK